MGSSARETWRGFDSCLEEAGAGKLGSRDIMLFLWPRRGRGLTLCDTSHVVFECCLVVFLINSRCL